MRTKLILGLVFVLFVGLSIFRLLQPVLSASLDFYSITDYPVGRDAWHMISADLNNDSKLDLVSVIKTDSNVTIFFGNDDGSFGGKTEYLVGLNPQWVTAVDLNNDQYQDLITANEGTDDISVLMNNQDGTFAVSVEYSAGDMASGVAAADLNEDGFQDLVVTNFNSDTLSVLLGNGDGTFNPKTDFPTGDGPWLGAGSAQDFNNDGHIDVGLNNEFDSNFSLFLGKGDGTFEPRVNFLSTWRAWGIIFADLNNDNNPDAITVNETSNTFSVLFGDGLGSFSGLTNYSTGDDPWYPMAIDANDDGYMDILIPNLNDNNFSVNINKGDGTFYPGYNIDTIGKPSIMVGGDFNKDSIIDFAITNINDINTKVRVYLNKISNIDCSLSPRSVLQGQPVTISATTSFLASNVWATVEKDGTILSTINLTGGPNDWSYAFATAGQNIGQNDVAVFANDGSQTYVCNPGDGSSWTEFSRQDIPWGPRYFTKVVEFQGKMWLIDREVWSSSDGSNWDKILDSTPWSTRVGYVLVVYDNKIWMFGGRNEVSPGVYNYFNQVWYSSNGITWKQADDAPWTARARMAVAVYNNKIYFQGGGNNTGLLDEVWTYDNATGWQPISSPTSLPRVYHQLEVFNDGTNGDQLWIVGGITTGNVFLNDVWASSDGQTWQQRLPGGSIWTPRAFHQSLIFDEKLWVISGRINLDPNTKNNDVWSTENGVDWNLVTDPDDFPPVGTQPSKWTHFMPKEGHAGLVFKDEMWILGGLAGRLNQTNDIWHSADGLTWGLIGNHYGAQFNPRVEGSVVVAQRTGDANPRIWLMGGFTVNPTSLANDIWYSDDGIDWHCLLGTYTDPVNGIQCENIGSPIWSSRWGSNLVFYDNSFWLIGGCTDISQIITGWWGCLPADLKKDVYKSTDGINWSCVYGSDPGCANILPSWTARFKPMVSVYNDKIWVMGGFQNSIIPSGTLKDVWSYNTTTGWVQEPDALWSSRQAAGTVVFNDGTGEKLWLMGGYDKPTPPFDPAYRENDVWNFDGTAWQCIAGSDLGCLHSNAPWPIRYGFGLTAYDDKMFVIQGNWRNDVWSSSNGYDWIQNTNSHPGRYRDFLAAVTFNNRIMTISGESGYGDRNDVWASKFDFSSMNFTVGTPPGGGPNCSDTKPEDPTSVSPSCTATGIGAISWNFQDNAVCENGYNLYEAGTDIKIKYVEIPNLSSVEENSGLSVNTQYNRYVKAYNAAGESAPTAVSSCFTLAKTPKQPIILSVTDTEIVLQIDPNDDNPAGTEYAIKELNSNEFVQADGTFGAEKVWQTYGNWGADSGVTIVALLLSDQAYSFVVIARNGDAIETAPSVSVSSTTPVLPAKAPNMVAAKGVAVNLVYNPSFFGRIAQAAGVFVLGNTNNPNASIIDEFSFLLNFILLVLVIILIINLFKTAQYLKQDSNCKKCLGVIWLLLINEPAKVYIDHAAKDSEGNYVISYDAHKKSHLFGRKTLLGVLSILALKLIILLTLIFGIAKVNHFGIAQTAPYDQTGQQVNVGDTLNYIVEFANQGTDIAKDVVVIDNLDSNLSYEANSAKIRIGLADITGGVVVSGNSLIFNLGNLNPGDSGYITFKASVSEGAEEQTINNLAQVSGSNFSDVFTNSTSNLVMAVVVPLCGNKVIDPVEQCDQSATPTGCASDEICVNCRCQAIPPLPVCGNGIREAGEQCDPIGCGADQICINCICQSNINTNINTNTNEIPPIPPIPPIAPPTIPPTIPPSIPPSGPGGINQPIFPPDIPIISAIFNPIFNLILDPVNTILENKQVEQVSQNVITPMLLAVAALTIIPAILATSIFVLPYLHLIFLEPFLLLFGKKRKKWGIVYNSLSKVPIDLALVRLYSQKDNRLIQTRVTDKEGRYLFVVSNPGRYYISVTKPGFSYPTKYLKDEKQDTKYLDLYHGEAIDVTEKNAVITANIPLDLAEQKALPIKEVITSYFVKNLRLVVSYIGMILALLIVLIYPTVITIGALMVHIALFLIFRRLQVPPKPKSWGIIYDSKTKEPLSQSVVRIFDLKFNKLLETQITDKNGRYSFLVGKNEYQLLTEKEGYKPKEVKPVDLVKNEEIVSMDISMLKS